MIEIYSRGQGRQALLAVALILLSMVDAPALADPLKGPACNVERVALPYETYDALGKWTGAHDVEMVLFRDRCEVKRLRTPSFDCEVSVGGIHAYTSVNCQQRPLARWRMRATSDKRSYFDTVGEGATAAVPSAAELHRTYMHLDDNDVAKPIDKDDFPKQFLFIGPSVPIQNPDLTVTMQSFRYRTMEGEDRLGISADASVDCVKYQFGVIIKPSSLSDNGKQQFDDAERDMEAFLTDLRLEHIEDPIGQLRSLQTVYDRDRLLEPITACVRH